MSGGTREPSSVDAIMRAAIDAVAGQDEVQRLARAIALTEGFAFFIAVCKSSRAAAAVQRWFAEALAVDSTSPRDVVSIAPLAESTPLEIGVLAAQVSESLTRAAAERGDGEPLVFLDASGARGVSRDVWLALFERLNERRNAISRDLGGVLVLLVPDVLEGGFAQAAPDLWSIRSLRVVVDEPPVAFSPGRPLIRAHDLALGNDDDPDGLALEVARQREQAQSGTPSSLRALRVLLMRLAGAHRRLGQLDESLALIDEAEALSEHLGDAEAPVACWLARAGVLFLRQEFGAAQALAQRAVAALAGSQDAYTLAEAQHQLADIMQARGELGEALRIRREELLPVYERLDEVRERAVTMGKIADVLAARGELDEALRIQRAEALPVFEHLGDKRSWAVTMGKVAGILQARGEVDEAVRIRRELLPVLERLGAAPDLAIERGNLATALFSRGRAGEAGEAISLLVEAFSEVRRLRLIPEIKWLKGLVVQLGLDPSAPPFTEASVDET